MKSVRSLEFDIAAFEDLAWWIEQDRQKALRIVSLIKDVQRDPMNFPAASCGVSKQFASLSSQQAAGNLPSEAEASGIQRYRKARAVEA